MENRKKLPGFVQANCISKAIYHPGLTANAFKLIKVGCYVLSERFRYDEVPNYNNYDLFKVCFSVKEFCELLEIKKGGNQFNSIQKALKEITSTIVEIDKNYIENGKPEKDFLFINWASFAEKIKNKIVIKFNPDMIKLMFNNLNQYSFLELKTIGMIKNIYALRIYELLKSFYNTKGKYGNASGQWATDFFSIGKLRKYLFCESKYLRNNQFIEKCLENPVKEINDVIREINLRNDYKLNFNISYEIKGKMGNKKIRFTGREISNVKGISFSREDSFEVRQEKNDILSEEVEFKSIREKFADRWLLLQNLAIEKSNNVMLRLPEASQMSKDLETFYFIKNNFIS